MNIRCAFCQVPYTLSRVEMLDALQEIDAHKLTHYDAHCPRCRRATQIPRQRIEMFMPNWRQELKAFEAEMKEHPQQEAPLPAQEVATAVEAEPAPKAAREKPVAKAKPAAKETTARVTSSAKKPAATATASKGKKTTKKNK